MKASSLFSPGGPHLFCTLESHGEVYKPRVLGSSQDQSHQNVGGGGRGQGRGRHSCVLKISGWFQWVVKSGDHWTTLAVFVLLRPARSQLGFQGCDLGVGGSHPSLSGQGEEEGGGKGSPQDRVALFCISFWLPSSAGLAEQRRLHAGQKRTVSPNEEQLRARDTAPHQPGTEGGRGEACRAA